MVRRGLLRTISLGAGLGVSGLLTGCGFRPVYGTGANGRSDAAMTGLSQVNVQPIPERSGQLLRNALQQRLEGTGGGATKLFDLVISYSVSQEGAAIDRGDSIATRTRVVGMATWSLVAQDAERHTVTSGRARSSDGFNPIDLQYFYSDLQVEQTQRRVAEAVADQMALQLATYFNSHPPGA